ncbi:FAD-binding oxidoreductase [Streptomyces sp. NPDC001617]
MTTDTTPALDRLVAGLARAAPGLRVETGPGATGLYAYDASNYRVPPRAVVFPRGTGDVCAVLRVCRETGVPVTARGGGTSMAGASTPSTGTPRPSSWPTASAAPHR